MKKNNSEGKSYYTQRNNKVKPTSSCNVTSMIASLSAAGWPVETMTSCDNQPEDELMRFIMTDAACDRKWRQLDSAGKIPPNEWHPVISFGVNRWLKTLGYNSNPVVFREDVTAAQITECINSGGAAVVSGRFTVAKNKHLDHVVSIVGYDDCGFIIDDPYGDYRDGYVSQNGNDVPLSFSEFTSIMKPQGAIRKWAHLVEAYEA